MHPILRLWLEHKSMPFAELLRVSERISADCSSAECAGWDLHSSCTACSLPFDRSKSTDFHRSCIVCYPVQYFRRCLESTYSSTAHHALIIGSVRKAFRFHKPPLASYSGISRTPSIFSRALPQIICFLSAPLLLHPLPILCLQGLCRVNQYRPFGHPVRPRTGFQYWWF